MKINVLPPDINISHYDFRPVDSKTISYGMNAIKNVGSKALETIIDERNKNGTYKTIFDLCSRVDQQKVNKRVLESLVMSGALDVLEGNRSQKYASIDEAIQYGHQMQVEKNVNQVDMFGNLSEKENLIKVPSLMDLEDWNEKDSLEKEKEVLGFYISGHPLL